MVPFMRRSEIHWTAICVLVAIPGVVLAVATVLTAQGPLVPDPVAIQAEREAWERARAFAPCVEAARAFDTTLVRFEAAVAEARVRAWNEMRCCPGPCRPPDPSDYDVAWEEVAPILPHARTLELQCRELADVAVPEARESWPGWKLAYNITRKIEDPGAPGCAQGAQEDRGRCLAAHNELQQQQRLRLQSWLERPGTDRGALEHHVSLAAGQIHLDARRAWERARSEKVRLPIVEGLVSRRTAALGAGIVALAAFLVSLWSLFAGVRRRKATAARLRALGAGGASGMARLDAQPDAGEPGAVLGAAAGAVLVAVVLDAERDPGVVLGDALLCATMAGVLVGLVAQWMARRLTAAEPVRRSASSFANSLRRALRRG